tara:strand:- start:128 stop:1891 length:1764 start_codon:yes stop_codon:yes gene_type:complete
MSFFKRVRKKARGVAAGKEGNLVFQEKISESKYKYLNTATDEIVILGRQEGAKGNPPLETPEAVSKTPNNPRPPGSGGRYALYWQDFRPAKYNISKKHGKTKYFQEKGVGMQSMANNWSLLRYRGTPLTAGATDEALKKEEYAKPQVWKGNQDIPTNPSAKTIIDTCANIKRSPGYQYTYRDFLWTRFYGKIPNNQMLTLRRFAFPVEDNIIQPKKFNADGKSFTTMQPALAQAITFMSPAAGNNLNDILKFTVGFNWKDAESKLQEINGQPKDRGMLGGFIDSMPFSENVIGGLAGESAGTTKRRKQQGSAWDPMKQTYPNHSLVPLNIIKSVRVREAGLTFSQEFKLKFEYDLKGMAKLNMSPKIAFLDVLANLLILTYNTAPFWGGAVRYTGGGKKGRPFGDLKKLQEMPVDIKGFFSSVIKDIGNFATASVKDILKGGDSKILNNILGGAMMDLFGGPQGGEVAAAFLSGDATGSWHLTIGNPLNPIAVIGNLACENAEFSFKGPLGYEDFPTKLEVICTLKPCRPRDKADIESMFNAGRGRLYVPAEGVLDPSKTYDVDAYGKTYGDKKGHMARQAGKFANG